MWKYICTALILICTLPVVKAQSVSENLLTGEWYVTRWETADRLLDFQDTTASLNFMVERFKRQHNLPAIQRDDSLRIKQELQKVMSGAAPLRFWLVLNKDKSFVWKRSSDDAGVQYKGTYALSSDNQALVLTSFDGISKAYQTTNLKLHALKANEMIIEIPSEEPGLKQSKFTLKRR